MDKEKACLRLLEIASNKQLTAADKINLTGDVLDLYSEGYSDYSGISLPLSSSEAATLKQKLTDVLKINTEAVKVYDEVEEGLKEAQIQADAFKEENEHLGPMGHMMTVVINNNMYTKSQFDHMKQIAHDEVEFTTAILNKMTIEGL